MTDDLRYPQRHIPALPSLKELVRLVRTAFSISLP
jgi:hypothetical protein